MFFSTSYYKNHDKKERLQAFFCSSLCFNELNVTWKFCEKVLKSTQETDKQCIIKKKALKISRKKNEKKERVNNKLKWKKLKQLIP